MVYNSGESKMNKINSLPLSKQTCELNIFWIKSYLKHKDMSEKVIEA